MSARIVSVAVVCVQWPFFTPNCTLDPIQPQGAHRQHHNHVSWCVPTVEVNDLDERAVLEGLPGGGSRPASHSEKSVYSSSSFGYHHVARTWQGLQQTIFVGQRVTISSRSRRRRRRSTTTGSAGSTSSTSASHFDQPWTPPRGAGYDLQKNFRARSGTRWSRRPYHFS